jgi:hypothetical protein
MFRFSTIGLAAAMSSPALWQAFVTESLDPTTALIRFLIAIPLSAVLLAIPRTVVGYYRRKQPVEPIQVDASRTDRAASAELTDPATA